MKLYNREDFIKLPKMTIYSIIPSSYGLMEGLFCKTTDSNDMSNDFCSQDLISEEGYPNNIEDGIEALTYQIGLRDSYKEFRTDLDCSSRDGCFDDDDKFIVWDKSDVTKLRDYLNQALKHYEPKD